MACQLRQMAIYDTDSRDRPLRPVVGRGAPEHPATAFRFRSERPWNRRGYRHHGRELVSVPSAVVLTSREQSDRLGCLEQSTDSRHHVDCGANLFTDHSGLYELGLSCRARTGNKRVYRRASGHELLRSGHVVFQLGIRSWSRLRVQNSECHVVRTRCGSASLRSPGRHDSLSEKLKRGPCARRCRHQRAVNLPALPTRQRGSKAGLYPIAHRYRRAGRAAAANHA